MDFAIQTSLGIIFMAMMVSAFTISMRILKFFQQKKKNKKSQFRF